MATPRISIVFLGSGPVAAKSLELLAGVFDIEAVITKPRPEHHRGDVPVLELCERMEALHDKVYTVASKQELSELFGRRHFASRLGVVVDFGIIIPQDVIDAFPLGIVNSHFSLLPEWRGADPITFAVLSGQKRTGVSLMLIVAKMDEGPLLAQAPYDIPDGVTTPGLTDALVDLSFHTLAEVLPRYVSGEVKPADQLAVTIAESHEPTYSRKLTKEDGLLDFSKPADVLEREIRAFAGWPKSRTVIGGTEVVVTRAHVQGDKQAGAGAAGNLWRGDKQFGFYCGEGVLVIDELRPAGKPTMSAEAFLNGRRV